MSCNMEQDRPDEKDRGIKAYFRAKRFLNTYRTAYEEYEEIMTRIHDLAHPAPRSVAIREDAIPSGKQTDISDLIAAKEELIGLYRERLCALRERMAAVRAAIEAVPDRMDQVILSFRYIDFMSFNAIAKEINEDPEYVYRHHRNALEKIEYQQIFDDG